MTNIKKLLTQVESRKLEFKMELPSNDIMSPEKQPT
jgi:hypothetical protein